VLSRTKVVVVGVGHLGSRHARIYAESSNAELVGVVDTDFARARSVADAHGVRAFDDVSELGSEITAASVAVPTVSHLEVSRKLFEAGVHVLVEKPIAASLPEAREMVELARRNGLTLAVGHTERHNPAVEALLASVRNPRFIEVHRLGSFSARSLDIDVVLDLMIHDLDVVAALVGEEVSSLEAVGVPVLTGRVDIANARIRFAGGSVANITASRVSLEKVRKLRCFEPARYVSLDYQKQEAVSYRLIRAEGAPPEIRREDFSVVQDEPLRRELEDFLRAVRTVGKPLVNGEDGAKALALALKVAAEIEEGKSVKTGDKGIGEIGG
jgi:predicted dehydrogenase